MQINNILNCRKPIGYNNFQSKERLADLQGKKRYKHYEEMNDDTLALVSLARAHKEVKNGDKMRLHKALPEITKILIATSIAIAQPGKTATKAAAGLGFLALEDIYTFGAKKIIKKQSKDKNVSLTKTLLSTIGYGIGLGIAALGISKGMKKFTSLKNPVSKFLASEAQQLNSEINSTKINTFVQNKINPAETNHPNLMKFGFDTLVPVGLIGLDVGGKVVLENSMTSDLKKKSMQNYNKAKAIQAISREHFKSIDAIEV